MGDYDLTPFGPWYGDLYSDIEATITSVNHLRRIPARVWVASHEYGVFEFDPEDLWDRYLAVIDEREIRLLDFLGTPRNMAEIVDASIVYGKKGEPKQFYEFGERALMGKHLDRLMSRGMVVCEGDTYRRA